MLSAKTLLLFLSACALAIPAPAAAPGELPPAERVGSADDPSWYCQWRRRVVFDTHTLEGRNWGSAGDEGLLRKQIGIHGGWVTNWHYENNGDGVFRARVSLCSFLPFFLLPSPLPLFYYFTFRSVAFHSSDCIHCALWLHAVSFCVRSFPLPFFPFPFPHPPTRDGSKQKGKTKTRANMFFFAPRWNLPISMHHNVEDNLDELLAPPDAHGIIYHDI
jgi:hypothetical protein